MIENIPGLGKILSKGLEFFQEKAFVYVDVTFGIDNPYCLTVTNRSNFDVYLNELVVEPNGLQINEKGWDVTKGDLFKNKTMKPGQKICFPFSYEDIKGSETKSFVINYCTFLFGQKIPRYPQKCEFKFDANTFTVQVSSHSTVAIESLKKI